MVDDISRGGAGITPAERGGRGERLRLRIPHVLLDIAVTVVWTSRDAAYASRFDTDASPRLNVPRACPRRGLPEDARIERHQRGLTSRPSRLPRVAMPQDEVPLF